MGPDPSSRVRPLALDTAIVAAISVFSAFLSGSRHWAGFNSPDSEFYASLAIFGSEVTDRALEPAYYWTRLGFIAPVRALVTVLGPWHGFMLWRFLLIALFVASLYWLVRQSSSQGLAAMVALFAALNTMLLSYVGIRLGILSRSRQWIQVLDLIGGGAGKHHVVAVRMPRILQHAGQSN